MRYRLSISRRASNELEQLATWIRKENPQAAANLLRAFDQAGARLLQLPESVGFYHHPAARRAGLRMSIIRGFPRHLIFFRVVARQVRVIRVLHGARDIPAALGLDQSVPPEASEAPAPADPPDAS